MKISNEWTTFVGTVRNPPEREAQKMKQQVDDYFYNGGDGMGNCRSVGKGTSRVRWLAYMGGADARRYGNYPAIGGGAVLS